MIREMNLLWTEKYRPHKIADCVLPAVVKSTFLDFVKSNTIPNMTLSGGAGIGKTSIIKALCDELDADYLFLNCSENGNIDTLRTYIREYSSHCSLNGNRKVVIFDEADGLTQLTQKALRGFIEEFPQVSFVLTCNFPNQIIEALHSRCPFEDFKITKEDKPRMMKEMHKRIESILKKENVEFDGKVIAKLVVKFFPDFRKTIGYLEKYSRSGKIDEGIFGLLEDVPIKALMIAMKDKNFGEVRKWVGLNMGNEPHALYRALYDAMYEYFPPSFIPEFILILGNYLDQSGRSIDQEICMLAFLTQLMASESFEVK